MTVEYALPQVHLRPARDDDFAALHAVRADVVAQHLLMAHPRAPVTEADTRAWIARRTVDSAGDFRIVGDVRDAALGFVQIVDIHRLDAYATLGICLAREHRGHGAGEAAMRAAMRFARHERGLHKLLLHVRADNAVALRLYARLGFREAGRLQDHYAETAERRHDAILLERLLTDVEAA